MPLIVTVFSYSYLFADTPGKAVMHDSRISFQGIQNIPNYTFYWSMERMSNTEPLSSDTSLYMSASQGAPFSYIFWGINKSTKKSTDTINFYNYYSPDYVVILNGVNQDSISFTRKELSNANNIVNEGNTDSIANKQLIADAKAEKRKHYVKVSLFVLAGVAALGGLIWFFVRRKKKRAVVS